MKAGVGLLEGEGWKEKQRLVMGGAVGHNLNLLSKKDVGMGARVG